MHRISRDRFSDWRDLDALVGAELDALDRRRPEQADTDGRAEPMEETDFAEEPFDVESDDEEAFIERTAAWLRERPDAEALLDAIRAALDDVAEAPTDIPAPDIAAADAPSPVGDVGEG